MEKSVESGRDVEHVGVEIDAFVEVCVPVAVAEYVADVCVADVTVVVSVVVGDGVVGVVIVEAPDAAGSEPGSRAEVALAFED